jgi:hypothetical protein
MVLSFEMQNSVKPTGPKRHLRGLWINHLPFRHRSRSQPVHLVESSREPIMQIFALLPVLFLSSLALAADYAIKAPAEAHIRQSIDVTWQAPQAKGGLLEIRPQDKAARRISYAYVRKNPTAIQAPEKPGVYDLVYVFKGEVRASSVLNVVMPQASVTGPQSAGAGETIEVNWTGPASRSDLITWAQRDGAFIRGSSYGYVQKATTGSRSLRAPADAGDYDIIYRSGSTILARHPITIGSIAATVEAPARIHAGGQIEVSFEGPENSGDRITFADRGGKARNGIGSYTYVGNAQGNSVTLRVGETPGEYDVVYLSNNRVIGRAAIEIVAASVDIDGPDEVPAGLRFNVTWTGAGNAGDRVVVSDADEREHDYSYIDPTKPSIELAAPKTTGDYSLVYLTRGGRVMDVATLRVRPSPVPPGQLIVTQQRAALGSDDAVEVILDASGSMLKRLGKARRIDIARRTLKELVTTTIPAGTGFALRVFGHREADSCRTDLEIPLRPLEPAAVAGVISTVNAKNLARTPIGASIARARVDLADVTGQRVLVILTDGEETCDGDPAGEIMALRNIGWDIRINIVGFAIDDAELIRTFEGWAAAGGGRYFNATNAEDLDKAMSRAVATRFAVHDAEANTVATGITGGEPITLPPGDYWVVTPRGRKPVSVMSDRSSSVQL